MENGSEEKKDAPERSLFARQRGPPDRFIANERVRSNLPKFARIRKSLEKSIDQSCNKTEKTRGKRIKSPSSSNPKQSAKRSRKTVVTNKKLAKKAANVEKEESDKEVMSVSDSSDVSEDDSSSLQCFVVVDPSPQGPSFMNPRVNVIEKFRPAIPRHCKEARLGDKIGSFECSRNFPGIPRKKFNQLDGKRADENKDKDWPIQALYQDTSDDPERLLIYYEGWTCFYLYPATRTQMRECAPLLLKCLDDRQRFVEAIRKRANDAYIAMKEEQGCYDPNVKKEDDPEYRYMFVEPKEKTNPCASFWHFEDLTYFHSIINSELNLAPVFYMALCEPRTVGKSIMPPTYAYTAVNIIPKEVYDFFLQQKFNKSYDDLMQGRRLFFSGHKNVCPSPGCVCDRIFPLLYRNKDPFTQQLKYTANGRLDFSKFNPRYPRVLIECSSRCGCDASCPRRALQRGQRKPLVVNYQPGVGYGLRTAEHVYAGELICEYTGELMFIKSTMIGRSEKMAKKRKRDHKEEEECLEEEETDEEAEESDDDDDEDGEEDEEEVTSGDDSDTEDQPVYCPVVRKIQGMKSSSVTSSEMHSMTISQSSLDTPPESSSYENSPPELEDDLNESFFESRNHHTTTVNKKRRSLTSPWKRQMTRRIVVTEHSEQNYIDTDVSGRTSPRNVAERMMDAKNTSYEAGFSVMTKNLSICALDTGNIARFCNHGCSPNAIFVECHSRRSEKDPLIPRIGVFAMRDIPLGDEVTVAYWTGEQLKKAILSTVPCKCGADNCIQFLPGSTKI